MKVPDGEHLVGGGYFQHEDVEKAAKRGMTVYAPPANEELTGSLRARHLASRAMTSSIRRSFGTFGLALAVLIAATEIVLEPWHVFSTPHVESAGHHDHGDDHSHHGHHDDGEGQEHEHHSLSDHDQSSMVSRVQPAFAVAVVVTLELSIVVHTKSNPVLAPVTEPFPFPKSPPDRRLSQRGPPRA